MGAGLAVDWCSLLQDNQHSHRLEDSPFWLLPVCAAAIEDIFQWTDKMRVQWRGASGTGDGLGRQGLKWKLLHGQWCSGNN
jgi:hypothetical protein